MSHAAAIRSITDWTKLRRFLAMKREVLGLTLAEGRMVYWSRSRKEIWRKGDTSGEVQFVREAYIDCDTDVLLFKVEQQGGGACHTGAFSCFFRSLDGAQRYPVT